QDLDGAGAKYFYCSTYGDGRFIARFFAPAIVNLNGGRGEPAPSINKAESKGKPVTQEIAVNVNADNVECVVNGTVVGTYPKSSIVGDGKLKSLDGAYGIRFS